MQKTYLYLLFALLMPFNISLAVEHDKSEGEIIVSAHGVVFKTLEELRQKKPGKTSNPATAYQAFIIYFGSEVDTVMYYDGNISSQPIDLGTGRVNAILVRNIHEKAILGSVPERARIVTSPHLASGVSLEHKETFFAHQNMIKTSLKILTSDWSFFSYHFQANVKDNHVVGSHLVSFGVDPLLSNGYTVNYQVRDLPDNHVGQKHLEILSETTYLSEDDLREIDWKSTTSIPKLGILIDQKSGLIAQIKSRNAVSDEVDPASKSAIPLPLSFIKFLRKDPKIASNRVTFSKADGHRVFTLPGDLFEELNHLPKTEESIAILTQKLGPGIWIQASAFGETFSFLPEKDFKVMTVSKIGGNLLLSKNPWVEKPVIFAEYTPRIEPYHVETAALSGLLHSIGCAAQFANSTL